MSEKSADERSREKSAFGRSTVEHEAMDYLSLSKAYSLCVALLLRAVLAIKETNDYLTTIFFYHPDLKPGVNDRRILLIHISFLHFNICARLQGHSLHNVAEFCSWRLLCISHGNIVVV